MKLLYLYSLNTVEKTSVCAMDLQIDCDIKDFVCREMQETSSVFGQRIDWTVQEVIEGKKKKA